MADHPDASVRQLDSVEGLKGASCIIKSVDVEN